MTHYAGEVVDAAYALVSPIHLGGMGEVWRAATLAEGQPVAIKFIGRDLLEDDVAWERLAREAENLAAVESCHVARLLDVGTDNLVMEYVSGASLAELLVQRGVVPASEVAELLRDCAAGLAAAHLAGVLHRDVKPSNILLAPGGAVLTDFGVSLAVGQEPLTDPGRVMGTAEYLAPELIRGAPSSPASDIYALGICAYEALTGHPPFRGATPFETACAHADLPVPALPAAVPALLRDLVAAMLSKDAGVRPTALRVAAAARGLLTNTARAQSGPDTLGRDQGAPRSRSQHSSEEDQW